MNNSKNKNNIVIENKWRLPRGIFLSHCVYMDFCILVMSLILVWNMFKVLPCTLTNMNIHIPIYVINIGVPVSHHSILFGKCLWCLLCTARTATIFKAEKNETTVANSGLGTVACQYSTANMAYLPHFKQWEKRLTTNITHDLTFVPYQAVPATVLRKKGVIIGHS